MSTESISATSQISEPQLFAGIFTSSKELVEYSTWALRIYMAGIFSIDFFSNKVFAVFLAEPVSDILAAAVTTITFFTLFNKILRQESR